MLYGHGHLWDLVKGKLSLRHNLFYFSGYIYVVYSRYCILLFILAIILLTTNAHHVDSLVIRTGRCSPEAILKHGCVYTQPWKVVEEEQSVKGTEPETILGKILPPPENRFISHGCPLKWKSLLLKNILSNAAYTILNVQHILFLFNGIHTK